MIQRGIQRDRIKKLCSHCQLGQGKVQTSVINIPTLTALGCLMAANTAKAKGQKSKSQQPGGITLPERAGKGMAGKGHQRVSHRWHVEKCF